MTYECPCQDNPNNSMGPHKVRSFSWQGLRTERPRLFRKVPAMETPQNNHAPEPLMLRNYLKTVSLADNHP